MVFPAFVPELLALDVTLVPVTVRAEGSSGLVNVALNELTVDLALTVSAPAVVTPADEAVLATVFAEPLTVRLETPLP